MFITDSIAECGILSECIRFLKECKMALFEIEMYNELVQRAVQNGGDSFYSDEWAETRYVEVSGRDEMDARRKILSKYPKDKGFIIKTIQPA